MTKDKTLTISRELLNKAVNGDRREHAEAMRELRELLHAAPFVERQDGLALMKIAADLANRAPLRQLYLISEYKGRISTDDLLEYIDKCGDLLAGVALDIRRAITSTPAPVAVVLPKRREQTPENPYLSEADHEWNACLDKVKGLNR